MFQLVKAEIFRTQETEKTEIDKIHSGGNKMSKEKVVLAYSGGLDTTAIIPWLKETFNYDVICCCIDCGQGENWTDWMKEQNFPDF